MPHSNVSIFIPHIGCPNCCSFCDQKSITGQQFIPRASDVKKLLDEQKNNVDSQKSEIAFFGGSFTAINREYMHELLEAAKPFVEKGFYKGIRISTRPDGIDDEVLDILKSYMVTTIELGAQSTNDSVLEHNDRGHSYLDIEKASKLIKSNGFNLGLQMMVGLYKSTPEIDEQTARDLIKLSPNEVRIYPVVILGNTKLSELYENGGYKPYDLETAVEICSRLLIQFENNGIKVIKLGLHSSEMVEQDMVAGLYHPAFRELCETMHFMNKISEQLLNTESININICIAKGRLSQAIGHKSSNKKRLISEGYNVKFSESAELRGYDIKIIEGEDSCT